MQSGSPDNSDYLRFPSEARKLRAYQEGCRAAQVYLERHGESVIRVAGGRYSANPYDSDSQLGEAWSRGWTNVIEHAFAPTCLP